MHQKIDLLKNLIPPILNFFIQFNYELWLKIRLYITHEDLPTLTPKRYGAG